MKVLIVNNMAPFIWGGAEELAINLQKSLISFGHESEILRIPFKWESASIITSQMMMVSALELHNADRVIALKFPAYLVGHPHKTLWLLHQYRQAYDLFDAGQSNIPPESQGDELRKIIKNADNKAFSECRKIFTNSGVTRSRLNHYNEVTAEVLLPPVNDPGLFTGGASGDYIFAGGRINRMKRQHLVLEALQYAKNAKLLIAGPPDSEEDAVRISEMVNRLGLSDRVKLDLRFLPRETYAEYLNGSTAVVYMPYDEDSLGYVAMESATAGKPIITTTDSGGILGLAKHNQTGWVVSPTPTAIGEALFSASKEPEITRRLGMNARELWNSFGVNWENTVTKLLQ